MMRGRMAGRGEQDLERASRTMFGSGIAKEARVMVTGEHDAVEILRELRRIGVGSDMAFVDRLAERRGDRLEPPSLELDQAVADRTGTVIELPRGGDEDAAAGKSIVPAQPAIEEGMEARNSARLGQRGSDDQLDEAVGAVLQHLDLEHFLGLE